jgi:predicted ATPase with chaperone activity
VIAARKLQAKRGQRIPNADLAFEQIAERCTPRAAALLQLAHNTGTGRGQLARVAQTVADLSSRQRVDEHAVCAAAALTGLGQYGLSRPESPSVERCR